MPLDPDRPILANEQDLLGRRPLVARLADWVRDAPLDEGFVIGLTGPWGSGKTSVLNLLEESLGLRQLSCGLSRGYSPMPTSS